MAAPAEHTLGRIAAGDGAAHRRRRRRWSALLREPGTVLGMFLALSLLLAGFLAPWLPLDDPYPSAGSHDSLTANRMISPYPRAYEGTAAPTSAARRAMVSTGPPRLLAESTPTGTATTSASANATAVSSAVGTVRRANWAAIGCSLT